MGKVFIVHGFEGSPNGGWRPWLMAELEKRGIYACALSMPSPKKPICAEWVEEISRHIERNKNDEMYLVGHSLGTPAILRYLESAPAGLAIAGVVLVSGPIEKTETKEIDNFLDKPFDYESIKSKAKKFAIIHGDNDPCVPLNNAETLSKELGGELIIVKNGGHLSGRDGYFSLPQCLNALVRMMG
ncbi:MAG: alpha/beta hydrolase [Candidatus Jorgensenbacteria bacterium]